MGFFRQQYWSGLPCPPPGDLPDPGIEPGSLMSPALAGRFFTSSATWAATRGPRPFHFLVQPQSALGKGRIQNKEIFKVSFILEFSILSFF